MIKEIIKLFNKKYLEKIIKKLNKEFGNLKSIALNLICSIVALSIIQTIYNFFGIREITLLTGILMLFNTYLVWKVLFYKYLPELIATGKSNRIKSFIKK